MDKLHAFWFPTDNPYSKIWYSHGRPLGTLPERDSAVEEFEPLLQQILADADRLAAVETARDALDLIVLLSELPRFLYAGTKQIFCGDALAFSLAERFAFAPEVQQLPLFEQYFLLLPFYYGEDAQALQRAIPQLEKLLQSTEPDSRSAIFLTKARKNFRANLKCLEEFGVYPHRNELLGRTNTLEQVQFLRQEKKLFLHALVEPSLDLVQTKVKRSALSKADRKRLRDERNQQIVHENSSKLRILVLHGWTQNGALLRTRVKRLRIALKDYAEFYFADGPHATEPGKEGQSLCWWRMKEENGTVTYDGLKATLGHIENIFRTQGPFDGVLGFSQGAALAGLLALLQPLGSIKFRFVVPISGFPVRDETYGARMESKKITGMPSFHILGLHDEQVSNERTEALAACFAEPSAVLSRHEGTHFAVNKWPLNELAVFVNEQLQEKKRTQGDQLPTLLTLEQKIEATLRTPLQDFCHPPQGLHATLQAVIEQDALWQKLTLDRGAATWGEVFPWLQALDEQLGVLSVQERVDNLLLLAWSSRAVILEGEAIYPEFFLLLLALFRIHPQAQDQLGLIPQFGSWRDFIALLDVLDELDEAVREEMKPPLMKQIVALYVSQLSHDRQCLEQLKADQQYAQSPVGDLSQQDFWPSKCAEQTPRIKTAAGKRHRLPQQIAKALYPLRIPEDYQPEEDPEGKQLDNTKRISYSLFQKLLSTISSLRQATTKEFFDNQSNQHRQRVLRGRLSDETWEKMVQETPVSSEVLHPRPEPVVPCPLSELDNLLDYLSNNFKPPEQTAFERGTIVPDGRLDLCKQVVGPKGILPLMQSMRGNEQVKRLLLGNNIVGDGGAQAIAEAIETNAVPNMDTWYIAGNDITAEGIKPICEALAHNRTVKSLWLKRNPLLPAGALHVSTLMKNNSMITTLDLDNCGLLDEGAASIVEGLRQNPVLQHLTISTNALTSVSAQLFADLLSQEHCNLRTLVMGINRIGDEGCRALAQVFYRNKRLERLGLPSCRISDAGVVALTEALAKSQHPLKYLDLGFMKATYAVKEIGNRLTDKSACALAAFLAKNPPLQMISLVNHSFEEPGLVELGKALESNTSLTSFGLTGFVSHPAYLGEHIVQLVSKNRESALANGVSEKELSEVEIPEYVEEIFSVYRTKSPAQKPFLNKFNWLQVADLN